MTQSGDPNSGTQQAGHLHQNLPCAYPGLWGVLLWCAPALYNLGHGRPTAYYPSWPGWSVPGGSIGLCWIPASASVRADPSGPAPALLDDAVPSVEDSTYLLDHQEVDICEALVCLRWCQAERR